MIGIKINNIEVYGIIYKITNTVNGKVYIGQTCQKRGFKDRYGAKGIASVYNKISKRNTSIHLKNSIDKYGYESFQINEIFDVAFSKEELNIKEICWISIYQSNNKKYGYNNCIGGNVTTGYKYTKKQKENVSKGKKGKYCRDKNHFYGKTHSEKQKAKWSKERKGRKLSAEWRQNIGKSQMKRVINLDTNLIFNSIKEATEYYNLKDSTHITRVCKGKCKTTGGYRWAYFYGDNYMSIPSQA